MPAGPRELVNVFRTGVWVVPIALIVGGLAVLITGNVFAPSNSSDSAAPLLCC